VSFSDTQAPTATQGSIAACYHTVAAANQAALDATTALTDTCDPTPTKAVQVSATEACNTTIVIRVKDSCDNFSDYTYTTSVDNTAPTVTAGSIGTCYQTVAAAEAAAIAATTATDNCPGTVTKTASTVGDCSATITVTGTDTCGNAASVTYSTRIDNTPPIVTAGSIGTCYQTVAAAEAAAIAATTATDNCPGTVNKTASTVGDCSATITVTGTDTCGNTASVTYSTRIDNTAPTVTAGSIATCYQTVAAAEAAAIAATTATDNCPGTVTKTASTVGTCEATITVTGTDTCGNAASVTYSTRIDNTPPIVTAGSIGTCYQTVAAAEAAAIAATTATDNCPGTVTKTASTVGTCSAMITVTGTDTCGNSASVCYYTRIDNTPPTFTCLGPTNAFAGANCQAAVPNVVSGVLDNCAGQLTVNQVPAPGTMVGLGTTNILVTVTDSCGNSAACNTSFTVLNDAPVIASVTGPSGPIQKGSSAALTVNFTDTGNQGHTYTFSWDDGSPDTTGSFSPNGTSGSKTVNHTYAAAGVYSVTVTVTDDCGVSAVYIFQYVVVYDPQGGFVTGGGWIISPPTAYVADPTLTGRANFGFVSKYQRNGTIPIGETEFQFQMANFNFHSTVYEWLVVAGARAQYKGSGTINGSGDYGFLLTATDGQVNGGGGFDKFRIKIWIKDATNTVVYDNAPSSDDIDASSFTVLSGGSIVVHR
jgi:hypothetical protein